MSNSQIVIICLDDLEYALEQIPQEIRAMEKRYSSQTSFELDVTFSKSQFQEVEVGAKGRKVKQHRLVSDGTVRLHRTGKLGNFSAKIVETLLRDTIDTLRSNGYIVLAADRDAFYETRDLLLEAS